MILNINKYESGGGIPPFSTYTPVTVNNAVAAPLSSATASTDTTEKGKLTDKDLLTMLKDIDGLPSDMLALYTNLLTFYALGGSSNPLDTGSLSTKYIQALQQIKNAKFYKATFEKAYDELKSNGGLNEIAITSSGGVIVEDEKEGIKAVGIEDAKGKHIFTNGELLRLRAEDPLFAGKNILSQIASNGIGMNKVQEMFKSNLQSLGEESYTREGYISGKTQEGLQLIQQLMNSDELAAGTDLEGLYKAKKITKEQKSKIEGVLTYAYSMLPDNAKTLLNIKMGGSENVSKMLYNMLLGTTKNESSLSMDYITDKEGHKPGEKAKADNEKQVSNDPVKGFVLGLGYQQDAYINIGTSNAFHVNGRFSTIVNKDGNAIKPNSNFNDLASSAFNPVLNLRSATLGGHLVDGDRNKILIDDPTIVRVDLPVDLEEKSRTGVIKPDLAMTKKMEDADAEVVTQGITDEAQINEIYKKYGLPDKFVRQGAGWKMNQQEWTSFAMVGVKAEESAFSDADSLDTSLLQEIDNENQKQEMISVFKKDDKKYSEGSLWWAKDFYKGQMFIPIQDNLVAASYGSGDYYKFNGNLANDAEEKFALRQEYVQPTSLAELMNE